MTLTNLYAYDGDRISVKDIPILITKNPQLKVVAIDDDDATPELVLKYLKNNKAKEKYYEVYWSKDGKTLVLK